MKKAALIPFLSLHLLCCGTLFYFLVTSGFLYLLSREGINKTLLLPSLYFLGALFWLYRYHQKTCHLKQKKSFQDVFINHTLWLFISFTAGLIFFVYIFIPWWIPTYRGGPLLP